MNQTTIKKLNELADILNKAAHLWRATAHIEVITELHLVERDTTADTVSGYQPGGVAQVVKPEMKVEYWLSQDEYAETLIEMPIVPAMKIDANYYVIDFHISAIKRLMIDYAPGDVDWKEAENYAAEKIKEANGQAF